MKRCVIIGAGPAGLTAGYELLKKSEEYEVVILEESDTVGGISKTVRYNGNRMDIGGHRFFSKDDRVTKWWENMMPLQGSPSFDDKILGRTMTLSENGPDPDQVDRVMLRRNRVSRIYYNHKFFDYPVKMNMNTIKNMGFVTTMQAGFSYLGSCIFKKPVDSLENFYINSFGRKLYSMFFEGYTEKLWGRHPSEIDASWGAQRTKGLSIAGIIRDVFIKMFNIKSAEVNTSLIEEFSYPKFGPGQLWETSAEEFTALGGTLKKCCRVCGLNSENGKITSVIYEENGEKITVDADVVISSMPLKDLVAAETSPVDGDIKRIAEGLPYRDFVTVGLLLNKLNIKNETELKTLNNIVPDCWIYVQDVGVKLGRIQIFNNWSPYLVKNPKETVWIGLEYFCTEGDEYWNMSGEEWKELGVSELIKMGVINAGEKVLDWHCEKVKKAYPAYFDTYAQIDKLIEHLDSFENLYCVGRNGQHRYNNMDHSMATSFEAVNNIIGGVKDKKNVWSVNTEQEYHEEKSN